MVLKSFDQPTVLKPHELGVYNPSLYTPFTEIVCETGASADQSGRKGCHRGDARIAAAHNLPGKP
jgi:hypothetical protein